MRQRSVKNLEEKLELNSSFLIRDPREVKGKWSEVFGNDNPIYLEIGCGKGQFIFTHASKNSDKNYIAIEGQENVALRALEKAEQGGLQNLRIFIDFVNDIKDYFEEGELSGVYLNFSDPWPKPRHEKRRFTYGNTLLKYKQILKPGGFVEFKTDNEDLFQYSLDEVARLELNMEEMTRDLHASNLTSKEFTTEYEEKFHGKGKNINYLRIRF